MEQITVETKPIEDRDAAYRVLQAGAEQLSTTEGMANRLLLLSNMVGGVNEAFTADVVEGSSFRDLTVNLLSSSLAEARFLEEYDPSAVYDDPDEAEEDKDYADYANQSLPGKVELLDDYMSLLASDPGIFADEISKTEGAYPDLRRRAPQERDALLAIAATDAERAAIPSTFAIYIESMMAAHEAENIVEQEEM